MLNLTFADNADALDAALAAFTQELSKLARHESTASSRPGAHKGKGNRGKHHPHTKRVAHSAVRSKAGKSVSRVNRAAHHATAASTSRHHQREPIRRSGPALARSVAALQNAIAWIESRLAQLGQAAGFELLGNRASD